MTSPNATVSITPELVQRFHHYHDLNPRLFHIVLDDSNVNELSAEHCQAQAYDREGIALAKLLVDMSDTQRRKLIREVWKLRR